MDLKICLVALISNGMNLLKMLINHQVNLKSVRIDLIEIRLVIPEMKHADRWTYLTSPSHVHFMQCR
jgi:hypothetical protein